MDKDDHLIFEALQNRGIRISIIDSIEDKQEGTSEPGYNPFKTTVKQFDAKHVAHALIKHAYGKLDQDRVEAALQGVLDSMEVNPYGAKPGIIELRIDEFPTDGMDHYIEAKIVGKEENAEGLSDAEYHKARKDALHGAGEELGHGPIKVQLKQNTTIDCYKAGTVQGVRFSKGTIFNCDENVGDYYECDTEEYGGVAVFPDDVTVLSGEENAEQYEQNRIVGNTVMQDDQEIGVFLGDSYSSKLTLHGKDMFMPGAPYAQTVNQGTHMGLWYKNKRHKLIVKDASKWKEFLSDIVSTGDDKYWDGKKMHQHDHMGDKIAADDAYWSKKIAAGADQRAENAEGRSNAQQTDASDTIRMKLGQAHDIVKGLITLLDKTPTGQTPYNEMAITHLVNLQEDLKELTMILQDRMLKK